MLGAYGGPRTLLRRLREVMAEQVTAQERLDKIVVLIAANMVAEVCSVYVLRIDGTLELYATEGLKREAVHLSSLRVGEGLVGTIAAQAEPLSLPEAQEHPAFKYLPETGEEIYHSFLGVPILRAGNTLGVLVVQNKVARTYSEEEIEALQTTAMVLAEIIASGELEQLAAPGAEPVARRPLHAHGVSLSEGIGLGYAVLHEPRLVVTNLIAESVPRELTRLEAAVEELRKSIDLMLDRGDLARTGDHRDVLEAFRMFAHDRGWFRRLREAVMTGITAEAAVERVQSDARARMLRQTDPFLRERLHDLDDLAHRLLAVLTGSDAPAKRELPNNAILVARTMGPAALLDYDRDRLRAVIVEEGGPMSHVTLVARALGIAMVGQVENATGLVEPGDAVIVDGLTGDIHVRPGPDVEHSYADKVRLRARRQDQYRKLRQKPCVTCDGARVSLNLNAGLLVDLPHVGETGADGIGLFRTELQFMLASALPRTDEQHKLYKAVLDGAGGRPVTFRTLDVGGDKVLPYLRTMPEDNPAMGWRAIRLSLDRPALLRTQVRALLRAGAGRELRVMFPMIASMIEFDAARKVIEREVHTMERRGQATPAELKIGLMLEVPSLLFQLDEVMRSADFVSVGSNDLLQYFFAADRTNSRVADRFDPLSPPVLRALKLIVSRAGDARRELTLCGELASRPIEALALIALGFRSISLSASAFGPVKAMLLDLDAVEAESAIAPYLGAAPPEKPAREALKAFASRTGVPL